MVPQSRGAHQAAADEALDLHLAGGSALIED